MKLIQVSHTIPKNEIPIDTLQEIARREMAQKLAHEIMENELMEVEETNELDRFFPDQVGLRITMRGLYLSPDEFRQIMFFLRQIRSITDSEATIGYVDFIKKILTDK